MIGEMPVRRVKLPILKLKGGSQIECQVVGDQVFAWSTHWVGGRSYVCPGETCPCCPDYDCRWQGWLLVRLVHGRNTRQRYLLELSATAFDRLNGLMRMDGRTELFGELLVMKRAKARSPLVIEPMGSASVEGVVVGKAAMVWDALATLYGLPSVNMKEGVDEWRVRAEARAAFLLQQASSRSARDC